MNAAPQVPILAPKNVVVNSITVLVTLSDGTVRNVLLSPRQAAKLHALLVHKVLGGRLRLSAEPVTSIKVKPPADAPLIIVP